MSAYKTQPFNITFAVYSVEILCQYFFLLSWNQNMQPRFLLKLFGNKEVDVRRELIKKLFQDQNLLIQNED